MGKVLTTMGMLALGTVLCCAAEKTGAPAKAARPAPTAEELGKRVSESQIRLEKESRRLEEDAARLKDNADAVAALGQCKTANAALAENLKAQAEAAKAADVAKLKTLQDQAKEQEKASAKLRNALALYRQAADARAQAQKLATVAGDGAAARQAYVEALNALAEFYTTQAKAPPETPRGTLTGEALAMEGTRKLARDKAKIEFEFQASVAPTKALAEKSAAVPAMKAACDAVIDRATAVRDAQLKALDAQDVLTKASQAKAQAEQALAETKKAQAPAPRAKPAK